MAIEFAITRIVNGIGAIFLEIHRPIQLNTSLKLNEKKSMTIEILLIEVRVTLIKEPH